MSEENKSTLYKALETVERKISKNGFETAYLFDKNAKELFRVIGGRRAVKLPAEMLKQMGGNFLTHNHPYYEYLEDYRNSNTSVLSSADLIVAYQNKPAESRMVIGNERHCFSWTGADKETAKDFITRLRIVEGFYDESLERLIEKLNSGGYTTSEQYFTEYCNITKKYADIVIDYFVKNQVIGYIFNKEIVAETI